jgi:hypothetical protein
MWRTLLVAYAVSLSASAEAAPVAHNENARMRGAVTTLTSLFTISSSVHSARHSKAVGLRLLNITHFVWTSAGRQIAGRIRNPVAWNEFVAPPAVGRDDRNPFAGAVRDLSVSRVLAVVRHHMGGSRPPSDRPIVVVRNGQYVRRQQAEGRKDGRGGTEWCAPDVISHDGAPRFVSCDSRLMLARMHST